MNNIHFNGTKSIEGRISIPASKSHAQRVLACALLNTKTTKIIGLGESLDERAVLGVLKTLGATVAWENNTLVIQGINFENVSATQIMLGESGLGTRMLTPIVALAKEKIFINGEGSILNRPMHFFSEVLPKLNVTIESNSGKLPLKVQGPLQPKTITVDASMSSQFITGLIMSYVGSTRTTEEQINLLNPTSIPYIELTLQTLKSFGISVTFTDFSLSFKGPYCWKNVSVVIERDWSSAAFFMVAAALFGELTFENMNLNSAQADKAILKVLTEFGASIDFTEKSEIIVKKGRRNNFHFDATHSPDLFPILSVLAAFGSATSSIKGLHRLKHKESDRAKSIVEEFGKFGVIFKTDNDTLYIHPQKSYSGAVIDPRNDHRILMSATIMALGIKEETTLLHPEVCAKSFPDFFEVLKPLIKDLPDSK